MMQAFQVTVNGSAVCVAGGDDMAVVTAILTWVANRAELSFHVGGLQHPDSIGERHVNWLDRNLAVGDEVVLRVVDVPAVDPPTSAGRRLERSTCSFCGKPQSRVAKLIAGAEVYICNECVQRVLPASMHESGGRPAYGYEQEDGSWHDRGRVERHDV